MSVYGVSAKDNKEQAELIRLIQEKHKPIIFCTGDSGTGKTLIAAATALDLLEQKKYKHLVYSRNPIQVGEKMGFLPGDLDDKFDPFMAPLYDNLEAIEIINKGGRNANDMAAKFECEPVSFVRGRSLQNTILIIDEAQNFDIMTLNTLITRIDTYSKIILLGSMNQVDDKAIRNNDITDFELVIEALKDKPYVGHVHLINSMRSPWCADVDQTLTKLWNEHKSSKSQRYDEARKVREANYAAAAGETRAIEEAHTYFSTVGDGIGEDRHYIITERGK